MVVDLDGTLGTFAFDGSCMSTNASASVSGSSSLSPKDHDYELVDSDLSEDVSLCNIRVWGEEGGTSRWWAIIRVCTLL